MTPERLYKPPPRAFYYRGATTLKKRQQIDWIITWLPLLLEAVALRDGHLGIVKNLTIPLTIPDRVNAYENAAKAISSERAASFLSSTTRMAYGAGDETRTRDVFLGKEVLYH